MTFAISKYTVVLRSSGRSINMVEPIIRFPEFKDKWNNYKIEDMFDRVRIPVDLDNSQIYREIGIRSHGKGIFHKEETTAAEIGNKRVFWVEPGCFVVNIVFAWERAVAKTTEKENGMIASHRFPMYKPKKDIVDLDYITEYFITKRGQNVLILASPGGAGRNKTLGQKEFAKSVVKLPSLPEQQKIAEFLSTIDTVIEKQKETVSAWEERKKGVMQKLFSQEVRFKADDGSEFLEWEEKRLGDILTYEQPTKYIVKSTEYNDDYNIPVLTAGQSLILGYTDERDGVYDASSTNPVIIFDDFTTSFHWIDFSFKVKSSAMKLLTLNDDKCNFSYVYNAMQFIDYVPMSHSRQWISTYSMFKVPVPCLAEQQKIADCLSSFDEVIEKQKATLAAWEEMKKGLLQQMFV